MLFRSLCYQQIMYSQAYSSGTESNLQLSRPCTKMAENRFGEAWKKRILSGSSLCGDIVSNIVQKNSIHQNGQRSDHDSKLETNNDRSNAGNYDDLKEYVSSASALLFATELCTRSVLESGDGHIVISSFVQSIMTDARTSFRPDSYQTNVPVDFAHITQQRESGWKALTEAFSMLDGELA